MQRSKGLQYIYSIPLLVRTGLPLSVGGATAVVWAATRFAYRWYESRHGGEAG